MMVFLTLTESEGFGILTLMVGRGYGLGNVRKLLEDIQAGRSYFDAIEIMACPGGGIGGGG